MKKKILDALAAKFEGVDAKILGRIADKLAKTTTDEEDIATVVEGVTFAEVLTMYGDSRATEAASTAISNYEKKHNIKNGKKVEEDDDDDDQNNIGIKDNDTPAWAKGLLKNLTDLTNEVNSIKKGKVVESRKAQFDKVLEGLTDTQKKAYLRIGLDNMSDEDFDTLLSEVSEETKELASGNVVSRTSFTPPMSTGKKGISKGASEEEQDDVLAKLGL